MRLRLRLSDAPTTIIAGAALALFVGGVAASAQPTSTVACAFGNCSPASAVSPQALAASFYTASIRSSRAARHDVSFQTRENADAGTASAFADAATVASDAFVSVAESSYGDYALAHVTGVVVAEGDEPSAALARGALIITFVPALGAAGRPSVAQIEQVLTAHPIGPQVSR